MSLQIHPIFVSKLLGAVAGTVGHGAFPMSHRLAFLVPKKPLHDVDSMSAVSTGLAEYQGVVKSVYQIEISSTRG
jgi:hypothetical protein